MNSFWDNGKAFHFLEVSSERKINKYFLWTDVNHLWLYFFLCVTSTFSPARREIFEYELYVIYRLLSRPSRSGGTDYSSIDYSYQLAIFLYPRATCHFVICLLPWKLSNCMESRENSPWSLCGRSSKCSTEGGWSNFALTSLLAVDFNYPYDLYLLLN